MSTTHYSPWSTGYPHTAENGELWQTKTPSGTIDLWVMVNGSLVWTDTPRKAEVALLLPGTQYRRVYPPGSVLPEPRPLTLDLLDGWPLWMVGTKVTGPNLKTWWTWELTYALDIQEIDAEEGLLGYPVQSLDNGAVVPVPWEILTPQQSHVCQTTSPFAANAKN